MVNALAVRAVFCAVLSASILAACHEDGPVVPSAITKFVMVSVTDPAAKRIFEAAAEPPQDDAGWRSVADGASETADSARRLIRAVRGGNKADWIGQANALIAASDEAATAAAAHDSTALAVAGDKLYATCESCHQRFKPESPKP